jgi:hypothetical protein
VPMGGLSEIPSELLGSYRVARVAADPAIRDIGKRPGAWEDIVLLSSPRLVAQILVALYSDEYTNVLARTVMEHSKSVDTWCIIDTYCQRRSHRDGELYRRLVTRLPTPKRPPFQRHPVTGILHAPVVALTPTNRLIEFIKARAAQETEEAE